MREELEVAEDDMTRVLGICEEAELNILEDSLQGTIEMIKDRRDSMEEMSEKIENFGTTKGAKSIDGNLYAELPTSPDPNLNDPLTSK